MVPRAAAHSHAAATKAAQRESFIGEHSRAGAVGHKDNSALFHAVKPYPDFSYGVVKFSSTC